MKTIEELIRKLIKNPTDYNIFIKFNSKTVNNEITKEHQSVGMDLDPLFC